MAAARQSRNNDLVVFVDNSQDENNPALANGLRAIPLGKGRRALGEIAKAGVQALKPKSARAQLPPGRPGLRSSLRSNSLKPATQTTAVATLQPVPARQPSAVERETEQEEEDDMMALSPAANRHDHSITTFHSQIELTDLCENTDPQYVSEYAADILRMWLYKEKRRVVGNQYMRQQAEINHKMRSILVDWLVEVHLKFKLVPETLHLAVSILDRYLAVISVARGKLQLIGITSMLIACKYQEIYPPEVNDFVYISDNAYTKLEILRMEESVLNTLGFNIATPSTHAFALRWVYLSNQSESPLVSNLVDYLLELALVDYDMLQYLPSHISVSALTLALQFAGLPFSNAQFLHSGLSSVEVDACVSDLTRLARAAIPDASTRLKAVHHKYSLAKYHKVSTQLDGILARY
eukprot:c32556_g1_i1.p1 GENE.c32556_g1_i1~~c32556_g1_i1.p1  ORF type:complete len:409 (-),score=103.88 c32556_g1_i1:242-1468(-)